MDLHFFWKLIENLLIFFLFEGITFIVVPSIGEMSLNVSFELKIDLLPIVEFLKKKEKGD